MIGDFGDDVKAPTGAVVMYDGLLSEIPSGWALCDGNNGTPNLLDRFIRGNDTTGATGGKNSYTLSESQLPSHGHTSGNTNSSGYHSHGYGISDEALSRSSESELAESTGSFNLSANGSHSHSMSVDFAGSNASIDNRPSFYEIAFIQKL